MKPDTTIQRARDVDAALELLCRALEDRDVTRVDVERDGNGAFFLRLTRPYRRTRPTRGEARGVDAR